MIACALALLLVSSADGGQVSEAARAKAKVHYQAARIYYSEGRFDKAAGEFRESFHIYPEPAFLFNIGQALEKSGKDREALAAYRQYLAARPDAEDRGLVLSTIGVLEKRIAPMDAGVAPHSSTNVDAGQPPSKRRPWTNVAIGASGATLAGGILFGFLEAQANGQLKTAGHSEPNALASNAKNMAKIANLLYTVSALSAAAAVVLWFVEAPRVTAGPLGIEVRF